MQAVGICAAAAFLHFLRRRPGLMVAISTITVVVLGVLAGIGILALGAWYITWRVVYTVPYILGCVGMAIA